VGRYQSFLAQGDASETFDAKCEAWPASHWIMIQGLGPNFGDTFKLDIGEREIKRYAPITGAQLAEMSGAIIRNETQDVF
jgi:hypothetical protein